MGNFLGNKAVRYWAHRKNARGQRIDNCNCDLLVDGKTIYCNERTRRGLFNPSSGGKDVLGSSKFNFWRFDWVRFNNSDLIILKGLYFGGMKFYLYDYLFEIQFVEKKEEYLFDTLIWNKIEFENLFFSDSFRKSKLKNSVLIHKRKKLIIFRVRFLSSYHSI